MQSVFFIKVLPLEAQGLSRVLVFVLVLPVLLKRVAVLDGLQSRRIVDALCRAPSLVGGGPDDVAVGVSELPRCPQMVGMVIQDAAGERLWARYGVLVAHPGAQGGVQRHHVRAPEIRVVLGLLHLLVQGRVMVGAGQNAGGWAGVFLVPFALHLRQRYEAVRT